MRLISQTHSFKMFRLEVKMETNQAIVVCN